MLDGLPYPQTQQVCGYSCRYLKLHSFSPDKYASHEVELRSLLSGMHRLWHLHVVYRVSADVLLAVLTPPEVQASLRELTGG